MSSGRPSIRILVVDDHPIIRQGIGALVATQPDMTIVAEAANGREAIQQFRVHRPDITLMDLQMPEMCGVDALSAIRSEFPEARIIILTTHSGDAQILRALKTGAQGYLLKNTFGKLVDTIRAVHAGHKQIAPEIAAELAEHAAEDELSSREIDVLRLIGAGNSNKQIADKLLIGETTVKNHVSSILLKLGANDRAHAVTIALQRGIIDLEALKR
jgi:DNA-binding NarL/FixJ family response regulator